jgi:Transposase
MITVGLDLGDRFSHYCVLNQDGEVVEEGRIPTSEAALRRQFEGEPRQRIAMECGMHSPWISRLLKQLGHQVMVANARKLRAISQNESKGEVRPGLGTAALGTETGRLRREARQEAGDRGCRSQAGSDFASYVAKRTGLSGFSGAGCSSGNRLTVFKRNPSGVQQLARFMAHLAFWRLRFSGLAPTGRPIFR